MNTKRSIKVGSKHINKRDNITHYNNYKSVQKKVSSHCNKHNNLIIIFMIIMIIITRLRFISPCFWTKVVWSGGGGVFCWWSFSLFRKKYKKVTYCLHSVVSWTLLYNIAVSRCHSRLHRGELQDKCWKNVWWLFWSEIIITIQLKAQTALWENTMGW